MLLPSGNPIKCHEEVLSLQPMIPPRRFDISPPLTRGCSQGLDAFIFSLNIQVVILLWDTYRATTLDLPALIYYINYIKAYRMCYIL